MPDIKTLIRYIQDNNSFLELVDWIKDQGWRDAAVQMAEVAVLIRSSIEFELQKWYFLLKS